ncbi:MAG: hypothetical protein BMS9Abin15_0872 [Gammaproteobacteria bacterium]|nr:MAG: hypothetical protein BMS9Abin15_0872 [Gammaproteobacteria bacterium]
MARIKGKPLRNKWHKHKKPKTVDEQAGALGYIVWRLAQDAAINLHGEDFIYNDDTQRLDVIAELLAFMVHLVDRIAYQAMPQAHRDRLINGLGIKVAGYMQDNRQDWQGPGDYKTPFVNLLNDRFGDYADLTFNQDGPGYSLLRFLGHAVQKLMGPGHQNKWVIDQIMDIEAPELYKRLRASMDSLLATGEIDLTPPAQTELEDHRPEVGKDGVIGPD